MNADDSIHDLRPGAWIRISGLDADDLICFTYVDGEKGLCAKGGHPGDADLAERPTITIHSLHSWPDLRWRYLADHETRALSLPSVPGWVQYYGPQPPPDTTWDPLLDDPRQEPRAPGRHSAEQMPPSRFGALQPSLRPWQVGDLVDNRFQVQQILGGPGRSGMGIVYVGHDEWLGRVCALKTLQNQFLQDAAMQARFRSEGLAWVRLDAHENITQALAWHYLGNRPCLLMEYVSGGDLGQWIGTPALIDHPDIALGFAIDFCSGMIHAASKGLRVHRDVKPQNCLITGDRTPRLLVTDFGLAKVMDVHVGDQDMEHHTTRLRFDPRVLGAHRTELGQAVGTCTHMAPEQFDNSSGVDVRADVYAFGVMLFQMLTGRLPFEGQTWEDFRRLHRTAPPPSLPPSASPHLDALIKTCLAKAPRGRYADFMLVRSHLSEIYRELTGGREHKGGSARVLDKGELTRKAMSLGFLGGADAAVRLYRQAIAENPPGTLEDWVGLTNALRGLGRYGEALTCADEAIRVNATSGGLWGAWLAKGEVLYALQRHGDALNCFDEALRLNPSIDIAWSRKAGILLLLDRYAEAADCYGHLLELVPDDVDHWWHWGEALRKSAREREALSKFDKAISLRPAHYPAWTSRALALAALGGKQDEDTRMQALYSIDQALEVAPSDAQVWFHKGILLIWYGREQDAVECFLEAQRLGDRSAPAMIAAIRERSRRG